MGLPKLKPRLTEPEYLALERASGERHFFLDGEINAMAGASPAHGDIAANVVGSVVVQLKGSPCRARTKDTKVRSGPTLSAGETRRCLFSYPDLVVICDEPECLDKQEDVILNPKVIMEILSASTEAFDRGPGTPALPIISSFPRTSRGSSTIPGNPTAPGSTATPAASALPPQSPQSLAHCIWRTCTTASLFHKNRLHPAENPS